MRSPFPSGADPVTGPPRSATALPLRALALAALLAAAGCGGDPAPAAWTTDPAEVVGAYEGCRDAVRVDLFLDATASMSGFVAPGTGSVYVQFLDNLEAAVSGAWADDSLRFYKFGETVRPIGRDEFRAARTEAFYRERGIFTRTNIDAVIDRADEGRVSVVVTDLFQDDGDINAIVSRVKERVFQRGLAAGLLALASPYDGTIYDAPSGTYPYASTADPATYRPFYALMLGDAACLHRLYDALRGQPFVSGEHFLLLDRTVVEGYTVALDKARDATALNRRTPPGPGHFAFDVRPDGTGGALEGTVVLRRRPTAPDVRADRLDLEVFRKPRGPQATDSTRSDDLRLRTAERRGDTLAVVLDYALADAPGAYTYLARLRARDIGGLAPPAWVRDLSATDPAADRDPNKTLNLEKFVGDLTQAAASAHRPVLAQFVLDVTKR
jgi:hypothetical protein